MNYLVLITLGTLLIVVFFAFTACSGIPQNPKRISITLSTGGGMSQNYTRIYISEDSCKYERSYYDQALKEQKKEQLTYNITKEELKTLYQVFRQKRFMGIRVRREEEVHDRGGTSVTLMVDGKNYGKANAGLSFIKKGSQKKFQVIVNAIAQLNASKIKNLK